MSDPAGLGHLCPEGEGGEGGTLHNPPPPLIPAEGLGLLLVGASLLFAGTLLLRSPARVGAASVVAAQACALLLPALLWARLRRAWKAAFPRARLGGRGVGKAVLIGLAGSFTAWGAAGLLERLPRVQEQDEALRVFLGEYSWPLRLVLFAATPAICEELFFRGAVLACFRRWSPFAACAVTAAAFALFHGSWQRALPLLILGYAMAHMVVRTENIWTAVVAHAAHNGLVLLAAQFPLQAPLPPAIYGAMASAGLFCFAWERLLWAGRRKAP